MSVQTKSASELVEISLQEARGQLFQSEHSWQLSLDIEASRGPIFKVQKQFSQQDEAIFRLSKGIYYMRVYYRYQNAVLRSCNNKREFAIDLSLDQYEIELCDEQSRVSKVLLLTLR